VRADGDPSAALARRTRHAVELWMRGEAPVIVFSGRGPAARRCEAEAAAEYARSLGLPPHATVLEIRSRDTEENARYTRELIGDRAVLIVTDAYHVLRCELTFRPHFSRVAVIAAPRHGRPPVAATTRELAALAVHAARLLGGLARASLRAPLGSSTASPGVWGA
jgi:uncharacterized SAM-binding protein YcdF (DUF218 family)